MLTLILFWWNKQIKETGKKTQNSIIPKYVSAIKSISQIIHKQKPFYNFIYFETWTDLISETRERLSLWNKCAAS